MFPEISILTFKMTHSIKISEINITEMYFAEFSGKNLNVEFLKVTTDNSQIRSRNWNLLQLLSNNQFLDRLVKIKNNFSSFKYNFSVKRIVSVPEKYKLLKSV